MPLFRVQTADHSYEVTATRVVADRGGLVFESRGQNVWVHRHQVPSADVVKLTRRINELSGAVSWVTERPLALGSAGA